MSNQRQQHAIEDRGILVKPRTRQRRKKNFSKFSGKHNYILKSTSMRFLSHKTMAKFAPHTFPHFPKIWLEIYNVVPK